MYQLNRLMRGKARSFAPIIMESKSFQRAGIDGSGKRKTMMIRAA